jgi:hypothetical protein
VLRILPHVIDTALLALGITLVVVGGWPLLQTPWLLAKIAGLLAYVALGTIALKRGRTKQIRSIALLRCWWWRISCWWPRPSWCCRSDPDPDEGRPAPSRSLPTPHSPIQPLDPEQVQRCPLC